eukprot:evm.model.scf_634.3 EVM.evm.TU.scf_634.3   scf_634:28232-28699(-)
MAISRRWATPEHRYRLWARGRGSDQPDFELGQVQCVQVSAGALWVANMVAQRGVRRSRGAAPIRYDALRACLSRVAAFAAGEGASVHMPRIGCGLAGGRWGDVERVVEEEVVGRGVAVYVYDLAAVGKGRGGRRRRGKSPESGEKGGEALLHPQP